MVTATKNRSLRNVTRGTVTRCAIQNWKMP